MASQEEKKWDGSERRNEASQEDFVRAVVCAIREELTFGGVPEEVHREQHAFLAEWIEEIRVKRERREKIKTQVMGWGIIAALSSIGTGGYHLFQYLRDHLK